MQESCRSASDDPPPPLKSGWSSSTKEYRLPSPPTPLGGKSGSFPDCKPRPTRVPRGPNAITRGSKAFDLPPLGQEIFGWGEEVSMQQGLRPPRILLGGFNDGLGLETRPRHILPGWEGLEEEGLREEAVGWKAFVRLRHRGHYMPDTCLKYVGFEPYRKLGMAIWDEERMIQLGLWDRKTFEKKRLYDAWIKVLSQDELAAAKAREKIDQDDDEW